MAFGQSGGVGDFVGARSECVEPGCFQRAELTLKVSADRLWRPRVCRDDMRVMRQITQAEVG